MAGHSRRLRVAVDPDRGHGTSSSIALRHQAALVETRYARTAAVRSALVAARSALPAVRYALTLAGAPPTAYPLVPADSPAPVAPEGSLRPRHRFQKRTRRQLSFVYAAAVDCSWIGPSREGYQAPLGIPAAEMGAGPGALAPQAHSALNSCFHFLMARSCSNWARKPRGYACRDETLFRAHEPPCRARDESGAVLLRRFVEDTSESSGHSIGHLVTSPSLALANDVSADRGPCCFYSLERRF